MSPRTVHHGVSVYEAALERLQRLYADGHRLVVSFSAGKDSGCVLELSIEAARREGRLPVDVVLRDEEVMLPGTYEYAERVWERPEVAGRWLIARQPSINAFDREHPYWWVYDPLLDPSEWVRPWPQYGEKFEPQNIQAIVSPSLFPPPEGKSLYTVMGLRTSESINRLMGLMSSGGYITGPREPYGVRAVRPVYDWQDGDVWKAHLEYGWDYNSAYDTMARMGLPKHLIRTAPPTMNASSIATLTAAARAWPQWFDRVCTRLPGTRSAVQFGKRSVSCQRRRGETWQSAFYRECVERAPRWVAERSRLLASRVLGAHARHSTSELPDTLRCPICGPLGSWRKLAEAMWGGDPFCVKTGGKLPLVEPEYFRPGAGRWGGAPTM